MLIDLIPNSITQTNYPRRHSHSIFALWFIQFLWQTTKLVWTLTLWINQLGLSHTNTFTTLSNLLTLHSIASLIRVYKSILCTIQFASKYLWVQLIFNITTKFLMLLISFSYLVLYTTYSSHPICITPSQQILHTTTI